PAEAGLSGLRLRKDSLYTMSASAMYALDAHSGAERCQISSDRWLTAAQGQTHVFPSLGNGTVYGMTASRYSATVYALDIPSGVERWTIEADSESAFEPTE